MTRRQIFIRGIFAGLLLGLIAQALNWLYSGHPDASAPRRLAVIVQAVVSALGVLWLARGIPGEPDMATSNPQASTRTPTSPNALSEGRWADAGQASASASPSPIPHDRPA